MTYNDIVNENIKYLGTLKRIKDEFDIEKYSDPDYLCETINIKDININLSIDGLCGIKKIIEFSEEDKIIENYDSIRKKYLKWPAYSMSINQQRGYKNIFDERIDLLMIDLQRFFHITENTSEYNTNMINDIINQCKLHRAYLNIFTFIWLISFNDFDTFIKNNQYEAFVEYDGIHYVAKNWVGSDSDKFDQQYFNALLERVKSYLKK